MLPVLYDTLDRFSMFDSFFDSNNSHHVSRRVPINTYVNTTDDKVIIEADTPGIEKEDLDIQFNNNMLTITGKRVFAGNEKYYYTRLRLPNTVNGSDIAASLNSGVLTVEVPKRPEMIARKIEVK